MGQNRVGRRFQAPANQNRVRTSDSRGWLIYRRSTHPAADSTPLSREFKIAASRRSMKWRKLTASSSLDLWWRECWQQGIAMTLVLYLTWIWLLSRGAVATPPSAYTLGTDLSIVQHNDLYGASSPRGAAAILLSGSKTWDDAEAVCASLSEQLWAPPADVSRAEFLNYLASSQESLADSEYFWVGGGSKCRAINRWGRVETVNCHSLLPALCSQNAPISSASSIDASARWQTSVISDGQTFTGFRDKLSFRFQGIRYAAQPMRFTHSTVLTGSGSTSALAFGPQCIQSGCTTSTCSEDCLFLNIWTSYLPHSKVNAPLKPVMLWIHGGGFTSGTGSDPTFDGGNLVSRGDVVLVTINYRLSTLGFLALDNNQTSGNYGIGDQITALEWVRAHIEDFGGNPNKITIYGQSAGAASVRALLGSPKAIGKFQGAIVMSNLAGLNYASTYSNYYTIAQEVAVAADPILSATGCAAQTDELACLRAYDPYTLATMSAIARYVVVDGTYITSNQLEVAGNGSAAQVPVMMGIMRDDGAAFSSYPTTTNLTQALTSNSLNASLVTASGQFTEPSGSNTTLDVFNVTARVTTDAEFRCLDQASAYAAVESRVFPELYFYEFNRSYQLSFWNPNAPTCLAPATPERPNGDTTAEYFKCHSGELYYTFGSLLFNGITPRDELDIPFSQYIVDTWASFARTQNPNPDRGFLESRGYTNTTSRMTSGGMWDAVSAHQPTLRQLQWETQQLPFKEAKQCNVLDFPLSYYLS